MKKTRIHLIAAALAPAVVATAALGADAADLQSRSDADPTRVPIDPSAWPLVVQGLIVAACTVLLIARERRRSYR